MAAVPNYSVSATPPTTPGSVGDLWFDTTNSVLNVWNTTNSVGRQGWLPITSPAINVALNASVVSIGPGQFDYIPAVVGTLGVSLTSMPPGQVAIVFDVVNSQLNVVGSGGATIKRSAAFT